MIYFMWWLRMSEISNEISDIKEKLIIAKKSLYEKIVRLNLERNNDKREKLLNEINTLRDMVDELSDAVEKKEGKSLRR